MCWITVDTVIKKNFSLLKSNVMGCVPEIKLKIALIIIKLKITIKQNVSYKTLCQVKG